MDRAVKKSELSNAHILAEEDALPSSVNSHTTNNCPYHVHLVLFFAFLCFVGDLAI